MINFLQWMKDLKHPEKQIKQRKEKRISLFSQLSLEMKQFVVFLRYESLTEMLPPKRTFQQIQKITSVNYTTAYNVCKTWVLSGCKFIKKKQNFACKLEKPEIVAHLTKQKTLIEWAHLSLHQRALKIYQLFGVKVTYQTVANFYKKHKITYKKPQYVYCRKQE